MKKFLIPVLFLFAISAYSQDNINTYIKEAQDYLVKKDYKNAQLSLQDAVNEISNLIAQQLVQSMPAEINGLKADGEGSVNTGAMGVMGGGIQITKSYKNPAKPENDAEVQIMANSPLLATMSMAMQNPAMMGQGYKSVRVGTRRAILKTETQDYYADNGTSKPIRSSEIQIPLSQTLITINAHGFASEAEELAFANKLEIDKLIAALGE